MFNIHILKRQFFTKKIDVLIFIKRCSDLNINLINLSNNNGR